MTLFLLAPITILVIIDLNLTLDIKKTLKEENKLIASQDTLIKDQDELINELAKELSSWIH